MAKRKVVVQGGGENLYEVSDYGGKYTAYKVNVGVISDDRTNIGSGRTLDEALSIIRAHSGRGIKEIS